MLCDAPCRRENTMNKLFNRVQGWLKGFARAREGNVAMMAGVALPVLLLMSAGAIDLHNFLRVKSELQDALDAASLAAARSPYTDQQRIQEVGMASMVANMPKYYLDNPGDVATFTISGKDKIVGSATVQVKTLIANTFLPPYGQLFDDYIPVTVGSEVMRASRNVEVALALDITYSMNNSMNALKSAARELIGIVVQDAEAQSPYTSKVALVPYSAAVNMGATYANLTRGPLVGSQSITNLGWPAAASVSVNTNNVSVSGSGNSRTSTWTSNSHGLNSNDWVLVRYTRSNTSFMYPAQITKINNNSFTVAHDGSKGSSYIYRKCSYSNCDARLQVGAQHGMSAGKYIKIAGHNSSLGSNPIIGKVRSVDNTYLYVSLDAWGTNAPNSANGGTFECGDDGCSTRIYDNTSGAQRELPGTNCVSERPWLNNKPHETTPGAGAWLGRAYMQTSGHYSCPAAEVMPLTSNKTALTQRVNSMVANGTTAGQIGIENAWYMLSPSFKSVYSSGQPNDYNPSETIKAAILMTDGEFNTPYCDGVARRMQPADSTANSVLSSWYINCPAGNMPAADIFKRSVEVCNEMKKQGIVIYTVGFALDSSTGGSGIDTAVEVLRECATSTENFHFTSSGTALEDAFRAIGRDITRLRIAR